MRDRFHKFNKLECVTFRRKFKLDGASERSTEIMARLTSELKEILYRELREFIEAGALEVKVDQDKCTATECRVGVS